MQQYTTTSDERLSTAASERVRRCAARRARVTLDGSCRCVLSDTTFPGATCITVQRASQLANVVVFGSYSFVSPGGCTPLCRLRSFLGTFNRRPPILAAGSFLCCYGVHVPSLHQLPHLNAPKRIISTARPPAAVTTGSARRSDRVLESFEQPKITRSILNVPACQRVKRSCVVLFVFNANEIRGVKTKQNIIVLGPACVFVFVFFCLVFFVLLHFFCLVFSIFCVCFCVFVSKFSCCLVFLCLCVCFFLSCSVFFVMCLVFCVLCFVFFRAFPFSQHFCSLHFFSLTPTQTRRRRFA